MILIFTQSPNFLDTDIKEPKIYANLIDKKQDEAIDKLPELMCR